jgi:hypothetical protein
MKKQIPLGIAGGAFASIAILAAVLFTSANVADNTTPEKNSAAVKNIVLVHGAFADGSGWEGVYKDLKKRGQCSRPCLRLRFPARRQRNPAGSAASRPAGAEFGYSAA